MPIYTYRCEHCGVQFERKQNFSDDPLKRCPECNKNALRKVYLPVGIVFKGSGFYATDNRSPSGGGRFAKKEGDSEKSSAESDEKSAAEKTEKATPAEKSD